MREYFIDALGDFCPIPNLKAQVAIKQMKPEDQVVLITDHSCTVSTLQAEMVKAGFRIEVEEIDYGIWQITISQPSVNKNLY